jgi:hypothetical protein
MSQERNGKRAVGVWERARAGRDELVRSALMVYCITIDTVVNPCRPPAILAVNTRRGSPRAEPGRATHLRSTITVEIMTRTTPERTRDRIPAGVWVLGFVSLLMDVSSEMIHSLLPLFMTTALGASAFLVGLIEGLAEATALIVKVFSGTLSDYLGRRKGLALVGYGLGALSKPLFAVAPGLGLVLGARLLDRVGKGIRGAPRDALVADLAPAYLRGAAFGLRQIQAIDIGLLFKSKN